MTTLLFVHGTGVRSVSFDETVQHLQAKIAEFKVPCDLQACPWGNTLGIDFAGLSLPQPPVRSDDEEAQAVRWEYLSVDPLFDLRLWLPDEGTTILFGGDESALSVWDKTISKFPASYSQQVELKALLERNQVEKFFLPAWRRVVNAGDMDAAFRSAEDDTPAISRVFAEAVVAQMMHDAAAADPPVSLTPEAGTKIVELLLLRWKQTTKGIKDSFKRFLGRATRTIIRPMRAHASQAIAPLIGDILNYQGVGQDIRDLIRDKIESIPGNVILLSHSLGGIACFELMVESRNSENRKLDRVKGLITAGSQAPLLYEFGALQTIKKSDPLPHEFPPWLNLYDENDLLSYRADRLFGDGHDLQVDSLLPPFEAHSAYWSLDKTWRAILDFAKKNA
jgi:hypothetical protein